MQAIVAVLLLFAVSVNAECDNSCSGHGDCGLDDVCTCYQNWGVGMSFLSGDCSERRCPYDIAFVDGPDMDGGFHKYAECSGRGICDRNTGECSCFDGYTGQGCQRTTCPNDCSGHGTCEYIEDMTFGSHSSYQAQHSMTDEDYNFNYYGWDKRKTRACVCDPSYGDYDCSARLCPHGNDVMDTRMNLLLDQQYHVQQLAFKFQTTALDNEGKTFALSMKSDANEVMRTEPIVFSSSDGSGMALSIQNAIKKLPFVDYDVKVTATYPDTTKAEVNITFVGCDRRGDQNFVVVHSKYCGDGCQPKLSGLDLKYLNNMVQSNVTEVNDADYNNYECGRHGKCDYETGECQCYNGFNGKACTMQISLQ